jgi:hypothetical protein
MSVDRQPTPFGRRGREIPSAPMIRARAPEPERTGGGILYLAALTGMLVIVAAALVWALAHVASVNAETARAEQRVVEIVNQPVTHLPRSGPVSVFSPGWFHPGALEPDFGHVDIRATQDFPYSGYEHVSSDLNPNEMFLGSELEFNSMTKYFYTDRSLPKKRLSEDEMIEINGLYRTIGSNAQALSAKWYWAIAGLAAAVLGLGSVLLLELLSRAQTS